MTFAFEDRRNPEETRFHSIHLLYALTSIFIIKVRFPSNFTSCPYRKKIRKILESAVHTVLNRYGLKFRRPLYVLGKSLIILKIPIIKIPP